MKRGIIGRALWSAHTKGVVPAAILGRVYTNGLVAAGTCPTNSSYEAFWGTSCRDSQFEIVGLVAGTKD